MLQIVFLWPISVICQLLLSRKKREWLLFLSTIAFVSWTKGKIEQWYSQSHEFGGKQLTTQYSSACWTLLNLKLGRVHLLSYIQTFWHPLTRRYTVPSTPKRVQPHSEEYEVIDLHYRGATEERNPCNPDLKGINDLIKDLHLAMSNVDVLTLKLKQWNLSPTCDQ